MTDFKVRTVSRRVRLVDLHRVKGDTYDIVYKEKRRIKRRETPINAEGLTFWENGTVIAWGNDSEHFSPATFHLLQQLWVAPDHFLSKEEIRDGVVRDEDATNEVLRTLVRQARREMEAVKFPHTIDTVRSQGYRLIVRPET